jgi:hypothetical protein
MHQALGGRYGLSFIAKSSVIDPMKRALVHKSRFMHQLLTPEINESNGAKLRCNRFTCWHVMPPAIYGFTPWADGYSMGCPPVTAMTAPVM